MQETNVGRVTTTTTTHCYKCSAWGGEIRRSTCCTWQGDFCFWCWCSKESGNWSLSSSSSLCLQSLSHLIAGSPRYFLWMMTVNNEMHRCDEELRYWCWEHWEHWEHWYHHIQFKLIFSKYPSTVRVSDRLQRSNSWYSVPAMTFFVISALIYYAIFTSKYWNLEKLYFNKNSLSKTSQQKLIFKWGKLNMIQWKTFVEWDFLNYMFDLEI